MNLDTALAQRFTELSSLPPQDIYDAIKFDMVKNKRVMIIWDLGSAVRRVDLCDETHPWRTLFGRRNG